MRFINIKSVPTKELVRIYNSLNDKQVKKFSDRETAERRVQASIDIQKADIVKQQPDWIIHLTDDPAIPRGPRLVMENMTPKEFKMAEAIYKSNNAILIDVLLEELEAAEDVVNRIAKRMIQRRIITIGDEGVIQLTHHCHNWMALHSGEVEFKKQNFTVPDRPAAGRKSEFAGKVIKVLVKENPRKEGSKGWHAFNLYKPSMTYEEYMLAGGGQNHLRWDIEHGAVEVE